MYQYMYALQTVSTTTDDTDYYDQFEQGNIGAQKEIEQVMQMYQTISPEEYLNIQQSKTQMQKLYRQIEDLSNEFSKIAWAKKVTQARYDLVREQISKIIRKTRLLKDQIQARADRIALYTKKLNQIQHDLIEINTNIAESKRMVSVFANSLYQIHNDYYGEWDQVDNLKLIVKSDNIAQTLWSEEMIKVINFQMDELLLNINSKQMNQLEYSQMLNNFRLQYKEELKKYQDSLEILNQQKQQLFEFVKLYKEDKIKLDQNAADIFITKQELRAYIQKIIWQIKAQVADNSIKIRPDQALSGNTIIDKADQANFLSRPIYPIQQFDSYYQDPIYKLKYGIHNPGVDIQTSQFNPIYAPANGIVYKVVDHDNGSLNRIILVHKYGYVTVMMPLNKIIVKQWQSIKRWQLIWYAWWEPGTRGAWFLSDSPVLHFEVLKNGKHIDPLSVLDLAVVMDKAQLPTQYLAKQEADKKLRPISLYDVNYIAGETLNSRRNNFLKKYGYGPFADLNVWESAHKDTNVDLDLWICIGFAESGMGRNLSSPWNIGNVGNNDRWDRRSYSGPVAGARSIYRALMNKMLGWYHTIFELSGYGNKSGPIYASSEYNREKNVVKCLTTIKWYRVPEDFPFRINQNKDDSIAYVNPTQVVKAEDRTHRAFTHMMPRYQSNSNHDF